MFGRQGNARGSRSFYEQLRAQDDNDDLEQQFGDGLDVDEENFRQPLNDLDTEDIGDGDSRVTTASMAFRDREARTQASSGNRRPSPPHWKGQDDDIDNDVPASLLVEPNEPDAAVGATLENDPQRVPHSQRHARPGPSTARTRAQWETVTTHQPLYHEGRPTSQRTLQRQPRSLLAGRLPGSAKEKAHWRWVNTSNLDSFMRDVYNYFEGGGLWCILCANALWLL
jgi:autophagy-related protein 9